MFPIDLLVNKELKTPTVGILTKTIWNGPSKRRCQYGMHVKSRSIGQVVMPIKKIPFPINKKTFATFSYFGHHLMNDAFGTLIATHAANTLNCLHMDLLQLLSINIENKNEISQDVSYWFHFL